MRDLILPQNISSTTMAAVALKNSQYWHLLRTRQAERQASELRLINTQKEWKSDFLEKKQCLEA